MTEENATTTHERPRTRKVIEALLKERQDMLVLLWELSKKDLQNVDQGMVDVLDDFIEILVDYIAAGHFSLYRRIAEGKERRTPVLKTAQEIYPRIAETAEVAIEFSERYEAADKGRLTSHLANDLSTLGEEVTARIELEDKLIMAMLGPDYALPESAGATV
jgi:regulator of sigma D